MYVGRRDYMIGTGCILALAIILLIRSFYSFCWSDESLYMAEVHRLFLGDRPFVDEWHPTQFFAVLLLPFYSLYMNVNGSAEGIYLVARICALVLSFILGVFTMYVLRKCRELSLYLCISAGMLTMLYSRANVGGVSYHNLFFFFFLMGDLLLYYTVSEKKRREDWNTKLSIYCILSGIFMGMAIITNPIFLMFYVLFSFFCFLYLLIKKEWKKYQPIVLLWCGTLLVGGVYLIFLFSKVSLNELLYSIPLILNDELHQPKQLGQYIRNICELFYYYSRYSIAYLFICIIVRLILHLCKIRCHDWMKSILFVLSMGTMFIDLKLNISSHMGAYVTFFVFGCTLLTLEWEKIKNRVFSRDVWIFFILPANVVIMTFAVASATGDPMTEGFVIFTLVVLVGLGLVVDKRMYQGLVLTACVIVIYFITTARVMTVYRDAPLEHLDTRIEAGPARGLLTTKEHSDKYMDCLETMEYINSLEYDEEDTIFIGRQAPWMYTATDIKNGTPYPWNLKMNSKTLGMYYKNHDIKRLKFVLILNEEYGDYEQAMNPEGTKDNPNKNELEGELFEYLNSGDYKKQTVSCGILYERQDD